MIAILIWARVLHKRLQHNLIYDPLTVFHDSSEDMDTNEVIELPCPCHVATSYMCMLLWTPTR